MTDAATGGQGGFSPRVVAAIIVVGVIAFGAFLVLSTYGPALRSGDDGRAHALSRSAIGYQGIVRLLRSAGVGVAASRSRPPATARSLWILTPRSSEGLAEALRGRREPTLIVLPKWNAPPSPRRMGWVAQGNLISPEELGRLFEGPGVEMGLVRAPGPVQSVFRGRGTAYREDFSIAPGPIQSLQTLTVPDAENAPIVELADENGRALLVQLREPLVNVYVLSDPDMLNNMGVRDLRTATAVTAVLQRLAGNNGVTFDLTFAGFERGRGLLRTAFEPPFLAATLCFVAAALFMGLHAAARFGPRARTQRVFALGKRALAENAAGLIALAGREARLMPAYAADTRTSVVRDTGAPRALEGEALDAFLDRMGAQLNTTDRWSALNQDAQNTTHPLTIAQRLWRWRTEMTRGRR